MRTGDRRAGRVFARARWMDRLVICDPHCPGIDQLPSSALLVADVAMLDLKRPDIRECAGPSTCTENWVSWPCFDIDGILQHLHRTPRPTQDDLS